MVDSSKVGSCPPSVNAILQDSVPILGKGRDCKEVFRGDTVTTPHIRGWGAWLVNHPIMVLVASRQLWAEGTPTAILQWGMLQVATSSWPKGPEMTEKVVRGGRQNRYVSKVHSRTPSTTCWFYTSRVGHQIRTAVYSSGCRLWVCKKRQEPSLTVQPPGPQCQSNSRKFSI